MKKSDPKPIEGVVIHLKPVPGGWVGAAYKDGKLVYEVTAATLYHSVAGQLRQYLDTGDKL